MATTKIWAIKDSLSRVLQYAANPDKTVLSDLKAVLHYAENNDKTVNEETCFVTGVNCNADTAFEEMLAVQERFGKTGRNVAYHAYQSFKTGEVTPELCHQLGVELARRMWGSDHQVLVATHMNTATLHNHFVVNAVNMWTGKKFNCNEGAYWKFRGLSDEISAEHNLTVIKNPKGKTPRSIYFAEKNGEPTAFNLMREAIDCSIAHSYSISSFDRVMKSQGYIVNINPRRRYWTIRSVNSDKAVRMYRLGDEYTNDAILRRIKVHYQQYGYKHFDDYHYSRVKMRDFQPRKIKYRGSFKLLKCFGGLYAKYLHYMYLMGKLPKWNQRRPLSPEMREAWRHLDRFSRQVTLVSNQKLNTLDNVRDYINHSEQGIKEVTELRQKIYNKLRRCNDEGRISELKKSRDDCTTLLRQLRKNKRIAETIIEDEPKIKENIRIETQARNEAYDLNKKQKQKSRQRSYER